MKINVLEDVPYLFVYKSENFVPNYCPKSWGATYTQGCFKVLKLKKCNVWWSYTTSVVCVITYVL